MNADLKKRLVALGADQLAEIILLLASDEDTMVRFEVPVLDAILASSEKQRKRFRKQLEAFKKSFDLYAYDHENEEYARDLSAMLRDLRFNVDHEAPLSLALLADFFQLGQLLDKENYITFAYEIECVFEVDAVETFTDLALACPNSEAVRALVMQIVIDDEWQLTKGLCASLSRFLSADQIRQLYDDLWAHYQLLSHAEASQTPDQASSVLTCLESCARALKDGDLFHTIHKLIAPSLSAQDQLLLGNVYLECSLPEKAIPFLESVDHNAGYYKTQADTLLFEIYQAAANQPEQIKIAKRLFDEKFSNENLVRLLAVIGADQHNAVMAQTWQTISQGKRPIAEHAVFLLDQGWHSQAATYILDRHDNLQALSYSTSIPLAQALAEHGHGLAASLIYREELLSILRRGYSKAYHHGVAYLRQLKRLAVHINDWQGHQDHQRFFDDIYYDHGRKYSFWRAYKA